MTATSALETMPRLRGAKVLRSEVFAAVQFQRMDPIALSRADAVWFGLGLCGKRLSTALPVDVLVMLAGQELMRQALGLRHSVVLIADTNAIAVGHPRAAVHAVADRVERQLLELAAALGFSIDLVRGSQIAPWSTMARQDVEVATLPPYEAHQVVQMDRMAQRGATLKLGWVMPGARWDERHFDALHRAHGHARLAYAYTVGGRAFDPHRPRQCPYVAEVAATRLVVGSSVPIAEQLEAAREHAPREVNGYRRLLRRIARALAQLEGEPCRIRSEHAVQAILDRMPDRSAQECG